MANIELSTAGISVQWAVEEVAGTRPTTGYQIIEGIKSTPDLNPEASAIDVTDLSQTEYKKYIAGLKDPGGSIAFGANLGQQFLDDWEALCDAYATAAADNKRLWFVIVIPGLSKAFYMAVEPVPLGMPAAEVDAGLEIDCHAAPRLIHGWDAKPAA